MCNIMTNGYGIKFVLVIVITMSLLFNSLFTGFMSPLVLDISNLSFCQTENHY